MEEDVGVVVAENMGLIRKEAKRGLRMVPRGLFDVEDLVQEICLALCQTMKYYDEDLGSLSNWIVMTARTAMQGLCRTYFRLKRRPTGGIIHIEDCSEDDAEALLPAVAGDNGFGARVDEWYASLTENERAIVESMTHESEAWKKAERFRKRKEKQYRKGRVVRGQNRVRVRMYQLGEALGMEQSEVSRCIKSVCLKAREIV